ncbi:MAG: chymotrypsin family serine protease [Bacillota bacterium]
MEEVRKAASRQRAALLALPNVVGVGVGYKQKGGEKTVKPAVVVMVRRKVPKDELAPQHLVPEKVEGVPTDVVEVGDLQPLARELAPQVTPADQRRRTSRLRPAAPGVSIGHYKISAGTLGAIVYDPGGHPFILSNNHVLANSTNGKDHRAKRGDPVLQPGAADGGQSGDAIGVLERYVPIKPRQTNLVDAALAKPRSAAVIKDEAIGLGRVTGVARPRLGLPVRKSGRTTGVTAGFIEIVDATVRVNYGDAPVSFGDQIILTPMSAPGDSGSLVVDEKNRAVGLLFAGSEQATVCSPIENVLAALKVGFRRVTR